jgi:RNA polymerase sigma factor (sigma-70 family)
LQYKQHTITLIDEQQLITGCLAGNRSSQAELYGLYSPKMMMVCLRYSKSREEAEEILQDGFIKVFKNIQQFRNEGSFEGWIRKIMVNCALQRYRSQLHLHRVVSMDAYGIERPFEQHIESNLTTKELLETVQQLPPGYRMVFNLYVFEGMKHREIAEALKISEGTSKSNLSDARMLLQRALAKNIKLAK